MKTIPEEFLDRFRRILPPQAAMEAEKFFYGNRPLTARVNTLKIPIGDAVAILQKRQIPCERAALCPEALIFPRGEKKALGELDLVGEGKLYFQSLSSMLPVLALAPRYGEKVLDMCAAPGSKATQIAALMQNKGQLVCLEPIRARFYKLKNIASLLGVTMAEFKCVDARRFRSAETFDRILLDVPCSCEGRFEAHEEKTFAYWSLRKIKEMRQKQRGIILNAGRLLKKGGTMVYATCTFAPEENEEVLDWFVRKTGDAFEIVPVAFPGVTTYPALSDWGARRYDARVNNCARVLPSALWEGFFIAKVMKR